MRGTFRGDVMATMLSTKKFDEEKDDIKIICGNDWYLIPNSQYEAQCIGFFQKPFFNQLKLYLRFKITSDGAHINKELIKSYRLPKSKKMARSSNYFHDWVLVNGRKLPSRNALMSPNIFKNKRILISTRTVTCDFNGVELPEHLHYSVVDKIIEVLVNG